MPGVLLYKLILTELTRTLLIMRAHLLALVQQQV
uniref:Uncharacterized protein n=1 Tax=Anguilla anguilla TaxID=7936 RepID=A0A0E9PAU5_ANGAN